MSPPAVLGALALAALVACGGSTTRASRLPAAGGDLDDGTGQLALASAKYLTGPADDKLQEFADDQPRIDVSGYDEYGGYQYGGSSYGGGLYGGASYAGYNPNAVVSQTSVDRQLDYTIHSLTDAGAVAGTVTWATAPGERRISSPCGEIDNPTLRLGTHNEAGGAIVYLDQITNGKSLPMGQKPLLTGGTVEKSACALRPTAQVFAPAPGVVTVYNDDKRDVMLARGPGKVDPVAVKLAPGGYRPVGVGLGITTIADQSGALVPAWIVAPGHPYVAMTDDRGRFTISDVVPGTYKLVVWHAPVVTGWRDGKPQYGAATTVTRTIKVGAYSTARSDVALKP